MRVLGFFIVALFNLCFAQEIQVPRNIKLIPYKFHITTKGQQGITGYYVEQLQQQSKNWVLKTITFDVKKKKKKNKKKQGHYILKTTKNLELVFDKNFRLLFFEQKVKSKKKKESWYRGKVLRNRLFLNNSRGISRDIAWENGMIPHKLLVLHFLTKEKLEIGYNKVVHIPTGEISQWKLSLKGIEIQKHYLNDRVEQIPAGAKKYDIGILKVVAKEFQDVIDEKTKEKTIVPKQEIHYDIAVNGKYVMPGMWLKTERFKIEKGLKEAKPNAISNWMLRYSWALVNKVLNPRILHKESVQSKMNRLRRAVANLLTADSNGKRHAIRTIGHLKIIRGAPALIEMLKDKDEKVRMDAHRTLRRMTKRNIPADIRLWRRWWLQRQRAKNN